MSSDLSTELLTQIRDGIFSVHDVLNERIRRVEDRLEQSILATARSFQNLEEGQKLVVDRLDRLVAATTRDRTEQIERLARLEVRVEALEGRP